MYRKVIIRVMCKKLPRGKRIAFYCRRRILEKYRKCPTLEQSRICKIVWVNSLRAKVSKHHAPLLVQRSAMRHCANRSALQEIQIGTFYGSKPRRVENLPI